MSTYEDKTRGVYGTVKVDTVACRISTLWQ